MVEKVFVLQTQVTLELLEVVEGLLKLVFLDQEQQLVEVVRVRLTILQEVLYHMLVVEVVDLFLLTLVLQALHVGLVELVETVEVNLEVAAQVEEMLLLIEVVAVVELVEMV
jgi:hypothetical protein|tara:strand:- start:17 stop:352 length:336 start_codon:yes stop_codon:yes gene_type:complete